MSIAIKNHAYTHIKTPQGNQVANRIINTMTEQLLITLADQQSTAQSIIAFYKWDFSGKNTDVEKVQSFLNQYRNKHIKITVEEI